MTSKINKKDIWGPLPTITHICQDALNWPNSGWNHSFHAQNQYKKQAKCNFGRWYCLHYHGLGTWCPTFIIKECIDVRFTPITNIMFPNRFKQTIVTPLLKKPTLDKYTFKNYRPASKFNFLSNVTEKAVASQIKLHIRQFDLDNCFQLAQFRTSLSLLLRYFPTVVTLKPAFC